jgi:hypothetical protein
MATDQQLEQALYKADKAGNVEDAKFIADEIRRRRKAKKGPEINNLAEGVRTFAKGATMGFADEIEAKVRTNQSVQDQVSRSGSYQDARNQLQQLQANRFQGNPVSNEQGQQLAQTMSNENNQLAQQQETRYKGVRDDLRAKSAEFARQNPNSALLLEMAGGIATPFLGAAKAATLGGKVARGSLQGAAYGSAYGAGNAEEMEDVTGQSAIQGALGGAVGGVLSGAGAVLAPKVSQATQKLMKNNDLTYGQMSGKGMFNTLEQKLGSVVTNVKTGRNRATAGWNREIAEEVLRPLGKTLPESIKDNNSASRYITQAVNEAYNEAFEGMNVKLTTKLSAQLDDVLSQSGLTGAAKKKLKSELSKIKSLARKKPTGRFVKDADTTIKNRIQAFRKSTNLNESPLEDPLRAARELFKESVIEQNPAQGAKWIATDKAYGQVASFQKAVGSGNKAGQFSPNQMKNAATEGMTSASKRISKANQSGYLQRLSGEAEDVLGDYVPDSGTAGNYLLNAGVAGYINPNALIAYVGAELAYSPYILKLANEYIRKSGSRAGLREYLQKYAGTATSGLLTLQD